MGVSTSRLRRTYRESDECEWQGRGDRVAVGRVPGASSRPLFCGAALAGMIGLALIPGTSEKPPSPVDASLLGRHPEMILAMAFSPDGRWLAASGYEGPVRIWDMSFRTLHATLEVEHGPACNLAWSPDGQTLAAAGMRHGATVWETRSWERVAVLHDRPGLARSLAWSPDGRTLATGGLDSMVALWDAASWQPRAILRGHGASVVSLAFAADGRSLVSAASDGQIRTWDAAAAEFVSARRFSASNLTSLCLSTAGEALATSRFRTLIRQDAAGAESTVADGPESYLAAACSPDGRALAVVTGSNTVEIWRGSPMVRLEILSGHASPVRTLAFSADGRALASGAHDGTIRTWTVPAEGPTLTARDTVSTD